MDTRINARVGGVSNTCVVMIILSDFIRQATAYVKAPGPRYDSSRGRFGFGKPPGRKCMQDRPKVVVFHADRCRHRGKAQDADLPRSQPLQHTNDKEKGQTPGNAEQ